MLGPCGSLIDGVANGGLSGSDVIVLADTFLTADVNGIANNTLQKVPLCTVAGLIQTQHVVFSINMPTMALARLLILSPSCVILAPSLTIILVHSVVNNA
jgi:hypothetical protein